MFLVHVQYCTVFDLRLSSKAKTIVKVIMGTLKQHSGKSNLLEYMTRGVVLSELTGATLWHLCIKSQLFSQFLLYFYELHIFIQSFKSRQLPLKKLLL